VKKEGVTPEDIVKKNAIKTKTLFNLKRVFCVYVLLKKM